MNNNQETKKFAVIGNPIKHSLSPQIHSLFAQEFNMNLTYQKIESEILDFEKTVYDFFETGWGLNITVPFKLRAFIMANGCDDYSQIAGSSNTLSVVNNQIYACNTDGGGLIRDFENHQIKVENAKVLIIGAGGATRGILKPLIDKNPSQITITNRSIDNAEKLANEFREYFDFQTLSFNQVNGNFDIVINATSLSLINDVPNINFKVYQNAVCYDLVYQLNSETAFKKISTKYGAKKSLDGLGMLVEQAALSFHIWNGVMPNTFGISQQLRK